ncbi:MAG: glutamate dehydrogenase [Polaribacter sp.]|nr:glutamate dehydrogenase [Polaribacter sp.]
MPFLLGLVTSYVGSISPSMLNITATKISIEQGKKIAIQFAIGVSVIVLFQAFFALLFLQVIHENPIILESIETAAIVVFSILSLVFFRKARQEQQEISATKSKPNGFITGMGLSAINMFSIPFYCGAGAAFNMYDWLELDTIDVLLFTLGATLGTYLILYSYILFAEKIKSKIAQFSKYFNYILSAITGFVAVISLVKIL